MRHSSSVACLASSGGAERTAGREREEPVVPVLTAGREPVAPDFTAGREPVVTFWEPVGTFWAPVVTAFTAGREPVVPEEESARRVPVLLMAGLEPLPPAPAGRGAFRRSRPMPVGSS